MPFLKFTGFFCWLLFYFTTFGQNTPLPNWNLRGEQLIKIKTTHFKSLKFNNTLSVNNIDSVYTTLYVNKLQYKKIVSTGAQPTFVTTHSLKHNFKMAASVNQLNNWDSYPTYQTYVLLMQQFAQNYPDLCSLQTIGTTVNGHKILVLMLSNNLIIDKPKPEVMLSSSMHGDELTGYVLLLRFIDYLLTNYNTDTNAYNIINKTHLYIAPLTNPDGAYYMGDNTVTGAIRGNANYIDLNRNFPDAIYGQNPDGNFLQPENQFMIDFMQQHNFVLSANIHGGAQVLNYPWDNQAQRHADDQWFKYICQMYADTAYNIDANYLTDFNNGITNGYDWYSISGGRQDYVTYFLNGREITAELSTDKMPDAQLLPHFWECNKKPLMNFVKQACFGLQGTIKNNAGEPVKAKITVLNHDNNNSFVYSNNNGNYYRLLFQGTYQVKFEADGYLPQTVDNININNNNTTILNITLQLGNSIKSNNTNKISLYPNPTNGTINIKYTNNNTYTTKIYVYNITGKIVYYNNNISTINYIDLNFLPKGCYYVKFYETHKITTQKIIIE